MGAKRIMEKRLLDLEFLYIFHEIHIFRTVSRFCGNNFTFAFCTELQNHFDTVELYDRGMVKTVNSVSQTPGTQSSVFLSLCCSF